MNLLMCIARVLSALKPRHQAYTTIVYPVFGQAVVIRDDLNIRHERPWYQVAESFQARFSEPAPDLWFSESSQTWEVIDSATAIDGFATTTLSFADTTISDHMQVNPANGLPMIDGCIDVMGNPFGTDMLSDSWSDSFSGFSGVDFG